MIIGQAILIVSLAGMIFATQILSWDYAVELMLAVISLFQIGFGIAAGPITVIYIADILPDIGMSFATAPMWFVYALIGYYFPIFKDGIGITSTFTIFLVLSVAGLIFILAIVKETKGLTHMQIWKLWGITGINKSMVFYNPRRCEEALEQEYPAIGLRNFFVEDGKDVEET